MPILQMYRRSDYEKYYSEGFWTRDHLLDTIREHVKRTPDKAAIVDGNTRTSWAQLDRHVIDAANALREEGIKSGDIVAVQLPNSLHLVVVCLALLKLGAIYHPINPSYRNKDVLKIISKSRPKKYIYTWEYRNFSYENLVESLRADLDLDLDPAPDFRIVDIDQPMTAAFKRVDNPPDFEAPDPDAIYLIGTTSGSTGDPKLYMHTHNTQFNEARILNREMGIGPDDTFLAFAPITHRGVFMWGFMQAMTAGASLIIQRVYNSQEIVARIDAEQATTMFAIPNQVIDLLNICETRNRGAESLKVLMMAGAPVQPELVVRIRQSWPDCAPVTGFGTSETGYAVITRPDYPVEHLQTCGKPLTGMEVAVDHATASDGNSGELVLRGPFVSAGYYANQIATDTAHDSDGWFHTGDLGFINADGNVVVTGRTKNVIIRSGLNIQAEEVEEVLLRHRDIAHAVVVGKPDNRTGERAIACVITHTDRQVSLSDITGFLENEGIAKFKWPEELVVMQEIPVNAAGKFDRIALRKQFNETSQAAEENNA
jgi:acyl-CoA synthetase (AMP-forming)/AMP-acid ligase II